MTTFMVALCSNGPTLDRLGQTSAPTPPACTTSRISLSPLLSALQLLPIISLRRYGTLTVTLPYHCILHSRSPQKLIFLLQCMTWMWHSVASNPTRPQDPTKFRVKFISLYLLSHCNQCYQEAKVPPSWLFSEVVMIINNTQKDSRLLSNHRPLSLTNISYKLFASMLQQKLERSLDSRIRDRQFGFSKNRSTTQPIHIIRRLLEVFERQNSPFHALCIDWSKAFDSATFTAIEVAMTYMGFPLTLGKLSWRYTISGKDVLLPICSALFSPHS